MVSFAVSTVFATSAAMLFLASPRPVKTHHQVHPNKSSAPILALYPHRTRNDVCTLADDPRNNFTPITEVYNFYMFIPKEYASGDKTSIADTIGTSSKSNTTLRQTKREIIRASLQAVMQTTLTVLDARRNLTKRFVEACKHVVHQTTPLSLALLGNTGSHSKNLSVSVNETVSNTTLVRNFMNRLRRVFSIGHQPQQQQMRQPHAVLYAQALLLSAQNSNKSKTASFVWPTNKKNCVLIKARACF